MTISPLWPKERKSMIIDAEITVTIPVKAEVEPFTDSYGQQNAALTEAWVQFTTLSELRWKRTALMLSDVEKIEHAALKTIKEGAK